MSSQIPARYNLVSEFLDAPAARHPHRAAILGEPSEVTYAELAALANRAGNALLSLGVRGGQRVLIVLPDSAEFMTAFFGAAKIGAIAVPVNPFARTSDYRHYVNDCTPSAVIVHAQAIAEFAPALQCVRGLPVVVVGDEDAKSFTPTLLRWSDCTDAASEQLALADTAASDAAFFLYTSGSGGPPKAAVHRHKDMLVASRAYAHGVLDLCSEDVTFSVSKLFFAYGLGNAMYFPFSVGARTILNPEHTKISRVVEMVARHRPTVFFAVPTFYGAVLRESQTGKIATDFSSVRLAVSAGEALPAEIFEQWERRFGMQILDGIGSTEMLHMFVSNRPGSAQPASCGIPVPGFEAKIVDEAGETVPDEAIGNLWVKGKSAFAEYWGLPGLTAETKRGDWVVTGDKFFRDGEGLYHYCGRSNDMLKIAGMWVSPNEVENVLLAHPAIAESAVVGIVDAQGLTLAVACVVLRSEMVESESLAGEIRQHVKNRLAAYKCPREVRFCSELPKTATGKLQRFKLRET
jgi:benzoate-CoA ligase family protein